MSPRRSGQFRIWQISFALLTIVGGICLAGLLGTSSESSAAFLFGYSLPRLLLAIILFLPSITFAFLSLVPRPILIERIERVLKRLASSNSYWIFFGFFVLNFVISWILFFLPEKRSIEWLNGLALYVTVAKPVWLYGILVFAIVSFHLLKAKYQLNVANLHQETAKIKLMGLIFVTFLGIVLLIAISGIGLGFDATIWNAPGTPIPSTQVFMVVGGSGLLLFGVFYFRNGKSLQTISTANLDLGLAAVIWIIAASFWLAQPAPSTYYDTPPQPPNYQTYPLSDAFNHDVIANNVLIGEGFHFGGQIAIRRPVYVLFLAGVESVFGANYDAIISTQVIVLAFFPALLYLLGAKIHSRLAGFLIAGFVIFREANSIVLGDVINASHAKLLMADLPTALMVSGFALAAFTWLKRVPNDLRRALLVGGLLGSSILLRSQSLTLLPFILLLVILILGFKRGWKPMVLFLLGIALVASPWIIRNKTRMGQWAIEDAVVSGFLANRYSFTPGTYGLPFLAGESEGEYYARQMGHVRDFAIQNPWYVAGFVADNFVRNQMLNFLVVPLSFQLRDLESHVRELPYWPGWEGQLAAESYLPMALSLVFVSVGISAAWKKFSWVGLLPLFINIGFTFNLALARVSGWRYNLPVDWTVLLYYAIGIAEVAVWLFLVAKDRVFVSKLLGIANESRNENKVSRKAPNSSVLILMTGSLFLLLFGSIFLIIEFVSHPRYEPLTKDEAIEVISSARVDNVNISDQQRIADLLVSGTAQAINGRALYPRYYHSGEGEPDRDFVLTDPVDFKRITFYLIGPNPSSVILRVNNADLDFPSGTDVVVVRCKGQIEAAGVLVSKDETTTLYFSNVLEKSCPEINN